MAEAELVAAPVTETLRAKHSAIGRAFRAIRRHPFGMIGLAIILVMVFVAVFADVLAPYDPEKAVGLGRDVILKPPSFDFPFGTDRYGYDMLSRVMVGARYSLGIGMSAMLIGVTAGTLIGLNSGYFGRKVDAAIQPLLDVWLAFPMLILLLLIMAVFGRSIRITIIAIAVGIMPILARIIRGAVLSEKQNQYIEASRVIGASHLRIMLRHVLPNVTPTIIVLATIILPAAVLAEASLGFLGLGVPPGTPTWGADLGGDRARSYWDIAWWWAFFPGAALALLVLAFNFFGDAMRDILDPRLRGR